MSWHYQLMRHVDNGEEWFGIHEYYNMTQTSAHSITPIVTGSSEQDVIWSLQMMLADIEKHGVKDYNG